MSTSWTSFSAWYWCSLFTLVSPPKAFVIVCSGKILEKRFLITVRDTGPSFFVRSLCCLWLWFDSRCCCCCCRCRVAVVVVVVIAAVITIEEGGLVEASFCSSLLRRQPSENNFYCAIGSRADLRSFLFPRRIRRPPYSFLTKPTMITHSSATAKNP